MTQITQIETDNIYYQQAFEHEVWDNYMCYLQFVDKDGNVLCNSNKFFHELSLQNTGKQYFSVNKDAKAIISLLYMRNEQPQVTIFDFKTLACYTKQVSRTDDIKLTIIGAQREIIWQNTLAFTACGFENHNIDLPIFKTWSKPEQIIF